MFILLLCIPFIVLLPLWGEFNIRSKCIINKSIILFLALMFTSFYLNGEDWANYYVTFFTDYGTSWFEPGFYIFFKLLSIITLGNFGLTIFIFYLLSFYLLINLLDKIKNINTPLFFILIIICFGNTLILEQLRQFYAVIFSLYALFYFLYDRSKKNGKYILFLILALSFHLSAIVLFFSFMVSRIKNTLVFTVVSLVFASVLITFFIIHSIILPTLILFPQLALKLTQYLEITTLGFHVGPSLIFGVMSLIYFLTHMNKISPRNGLEWIIFRQIFLGVLIFLVGLYVPFATRFSVFYIAYLFLYSSALRYTLEKITIFNLPRFYFLMLLILFVVSNNFSYYRNDIAPIQFRNITMNLWPFISDNLNYDMLVSDIYRNNYEKLNQYRDSQGK